MARIQLIFFVSLYLQTYLNFAFECVIMKQIQLPAMETSISDINDGTVNKIRIVGSIVSKEENGFILDDTTGAIKIIVDTSSSNSLIEKTPVQVIGRVLKTEDGFELRADFVNKLDEINLKLYRKVNNAIKKDESF